LLSILGCKVLRHEEHTNENEKQLQYFSKTIVGWDDEESSFVFELIYNYGI